MVAGVALIKSQKHTERLENKLNQERQSKLWQDSKMISPVLTVPAGIAEETRTVRQTHSSEADETDYIEAGTMNTVLCPSTAMADRVWERDIKALKDWSDSGLYFAQGFYAGQVRIDPNNPKWVEAAQAVTAELVYRKLAK